ncbi:MAG TPA: polynucleotide adenylyltransferase PcnB, partial [Candidatus Sumerlaeota bacterium]|nr:polynucleotide adenylyltransferase PcnB [Candidatus Sumerlaeota bacterium]
MGTERIYTIALGIVRELQAAGHRALFVGGCVRDELLGIPLKDIDIATDAHPDRVLEIFPDARLV